MGCDIHIFTEKKNKDGVWESMNTWCCEEEEDYTHYSAQDEIYDGRNYKLFAMLASVRNNHGFAGCDMGDRINPISIPKGLPADVSMEVTRVSEQWGCDGHSHSYFTLQELLNYDWTQVVNCRGVVRATEFERWTRWGRSQGKGPDTYAGAISGRDITQITPKAMEEQVLKIVDNFKYGSNYHREIEVELQDKIGNFVTQVEWIEPYYQLSSDFLSTVIPKMLRLSEGSFEDVRIVFFFDN